MEYKYDIAISYQSEMEKTAQKITDYLKKEFGLPNSARVPIWANATHNSSLISASPRVISATFSVASYGRFAVAMGAALYAETSGGTYTMARLRENIAMGYSRVLCRLSSSSSSAVMPSRVAIWSIKAPVPPAQEPFIRSSIPPSKKMILASKLDDAHAVFPEYGRFAVAMGAALYAEESGGVYTMDQLREKIASAVIFRRLAIWSMKAWTSCGRRS